MKNSAFLFLFLVASIKTNFAQISFEIQGKGSYNSTWIVNKNISDKGDEQDYDIAWAYNYGAGFNLYLGRIGIGIEGLFGYHKAAYAGTIGTSFPLSYSSVVDLKTSHIPLLLKIKGKKAGYFEAGVQMNSISKATYTISGDVVFPSNNIDVLNKYSKTYLSAIIGAGATIKPFKNFPLGILIGARLQYGFDDVKGVDALANDLNNSLIYPEKQASNVISGGMFVGLTYTLSRNNDR
jgi:hypothetical protein